MSINLSIPEAADAPELKPRITVVGVGGAGGNAVNNMIRLDLAGVEYLVCNTDAQALRQSRADRRIQLGSAITQGLGAGSRPDVGRQAAEEAIEEIANDLRGVNMAFIAAGMGGGTGTGAAPVIARACRELGILTVGVVTKPFQFEGSHRMKLADAGIQELEQYVDTLIIIPNQNLFRIANEKTTFADAFSMADDVLYSGVRGVTDLMVMPGLINLDFADVRAVMSEMGKAMMGTGEATGERRALDAAEAAIANPLLDDASMKGAKGVLINITGGADMTLFEVDEAANRIRAEVDDEAFIIFGAAFDQGIEGKLRVSVVATGIDAVAMQRPLPMMGEPRLRAMARTMPAKEKAPAAILVPKAEPAPAPIVATAEAAPAVAVAAVAEAVAVAEPAPVAQTEVAEAITLDGADTMPTVEAVVEAPAPIAAAVAAPAQTPIAAALAAAPVIPPAPARRPAAVHELKRPAAMPAIGTGDAFIPPAPVEATGDTRVVRADPFAQADMVNPPKEVARESKVEAPRPVAAPVVPPVAPIPAPAAVATPAAPTLVAAQPAPKARALSLFERVTGVHRSRSEAKAETPAPAPKVTIPASPSRLGGVAVQDRPAPQRVEDDLLDIPAFLRRQAN